MKLRRSAAVVTAFLVAGVALAVTPGTSAAGPPIARDPSVIVRWNEIADRTLAENAVPVPASSLYLGFAALAVYDAVVAIEGRFEPWADQPRPHANASPEVAAATAAYHVLRHYFPNSANALAADYAASLARVPNGVGKVHGTRVGEAAAARLIAERSGDGRNASVPQPGDGTPGPGDWRPTPPAWPMAVPWLGFVDPLVLASPTPIPLAGPPALESADYAADFAEVRDFGGTSSNRTPGADRHRAVLERQPGAPIQHRDARPGVGSRVGHRRQRPGVRPPPQQHGRRPHRLLVGEVRRQLLASRDGDRAGRHRRQRRDRRGARLDAAPDDPAVRRLHQRACVRHRGDDGCPRASVRLVAAAGAGRAVPGAERPEPAVLRHRSPRRRGDERPHLARLPLPLGDDRRQRPRPRGRRPRSQRTTSKLPPDRRSPVEPACSAPVHQPGGLALRQLRCASPAGSCRGAPSWRRRSSPWTRRGTASCRRCRRRAGTGCRRGGSRC